MNNKDITAVITSFRSKNKIINCIKSLGKEIDLIIDIVREALIEFS